MDIEQAANALKELGHPTRLTLFRLLVKSGRAGLTVGGIQDELGIPNSTLSHHISRLVSVGLVIQQREGRVLKCFPQYELLNSLIFFLKDECCLDSSIADKNNKSLKYG